MGTKFSAVGPVGKETGRGLLGAVLAVFTATAVLAAESYPSKPSRLIVPMAPGGTHDIMGRMMATKLTERLGKQMIVESHGGGGGIIGMELVAKADPDGYTLLVVAANFTTQSALQKLPYDPLKSFAPVAKLAGMPFVLVVHPNVPAKSVKELIALAKQKPGQLIFVATGPGGTAHLGEELLKISAGIDFKIVHFKGAAPSTIDLLGGHSDANLTTVVGVLPHIRAGKLRVLATGGAKPSAALPGVPTMAESLPGYELTQWYGIVSPAGVPAPILDRLANEIKAILAEDEIKKRILNDGAEVDYQGPTEFGRFIEREITNWARVVKKANIKLN